jgi:SAM-dependent methyltransferase
MTPQISSHWHEPSVVDEFVRREPDHRLVALLDEEQDPSRLRVLDLGCAGGRNTVVLAARGCDTYAVDLSPEMIEATRSRIAPILGEAEANARVVLAPMDDLSMFPAALFDLVVALGIHHQASTVAEWSRAVDETVRVLRSGGRFLVAHFAPGTDLSGEHGQPIEGSPDRMSCATVERRCCTTPKLSMRGCVSAASHRSFRPRPSSACVTREANG